MGTHGLQAKIYTWILLIQKSKQWNGVGDI